MKKLTLNELENISGGFGTVGQVVTGYIKGVFGGAVTGGLVGGVATGGVWLVGKAFGVNFFEPKIIGYVAGTCAAVGASAGTVGATIYAYDPENFSENMKSVGKTVETLGNVVKVVNDVDKIVDRRRSR